MSKPSQAYFANRRSRIADRLGVDAALIIANPTMPSFVESQYCPYQLNNDFYYLTGCVEDHMLAVLLPTSTGYDFIVFCEANDPNKAQWEGERLGQSGVVEVLGATAAYPIAELEKRLAELLCKRRVCYYPQHDSIGLNQVMETITQPPIEYRDSHSLLAEYRLIKDDLEIACLQKAIDISIQGHRRAMAFTKPGVSEALLHAEFMHECIQSGCLEPAYSPIVASGMNACILHYAESKAVLGENDLVLIDAGARYQQYCADITRTFPVNKSFSGEQRAIYDIVLDAQLAGIAAIRPGNRFDEPEMRVVHTITQGLKDLGLLQGDCDSLIEQKAYRPFYMHRSSHWLGLATHDVGEYKTTETPPNARYFETGMVLTIEPGIYIHPQYVKTDPKWAGIGVRIEDDVLVTQQACDVLSQALPKTVIDIEAIIGIAYD